MEVSSSRQGKRYAVVDTRTTVNLGKYDEKLNKFIPGTEKDISGGDRSSKSKTLA